MKANIEVKDRREADAIRVALEDETTRAIVVVMGILRGLSSERARQRVLQYVMDALGEFEQSKQQEEKS
jgi:hypothetical protein